MACPGHVPSVGPMEMRSHGKPKVLIAGGGVAGLEALLALRANLRGRVDIELLSAEEELVYRPLSVREPFGLGHPRRYELAPIADEHSARLTFGTLSAVDAEARTAITADGDELAFDQLLVAVGAVQRPALPGAIAFRGPADRRPMRELLGDAETGSVRSIVFSVPVGITWALPLYELALMTAAHLQEQGLTDVHVALVTPEPAPLSVFGPRGSAAVRKLLAERGIELRTSVYPASVEPTSLTLTPGGWIKADRVVTLPLLRGPAIPGLPHDADGFIPIDEHCAVEGLESVYAAGDATSFPVKQGGIAAQMADAAVSSIAAAMTGGEAEPFRPVLRGMVLTGYSPTFLRAEPAGRSRGTSTGVATHSLWEPAAKVAARHLGPYLAGLGHAQLERSELRDLDEEPSGPPVQSSAEHSAAVELALALADADAGWADYREALEWLDRVEAIEGVLPPAYEQRRARWSRALSHQEGR